MLREDIATHKSCSEKLEADLPTANQGIQRMNEHTAHAPTQVFNYLDALFFQETTTCICPAATKAHCYHHPKDRFHQLPQIRLGLATDTPPEIARAVIQEQFNKTVFLFVLMPHRSFYYQLASKLPSTGQGVAMSYLDLHPPADEPKMVSQERTYFEEFLDYVLTNCFATLTFNEVKVKYKNLKQSSGQTPKAYIGDGKSISLD